MRTFKVIANEIDLLLTHSASNFETHLEGSLGTDADNLIWTADKVDGQLAQIAEKVAELMSLASDARERIMLLRRA